MNVIHVLADGTIKKDLTGYEINSCIDDFYHVLTKIYRSRLNEEKNQNEN